MAGTFIAIELDETAAANLDLAKQLSEICPVDIFAVGETGVELVEENLDECVLCELCIRAAPEGAIRIVKLYSGETLPARTGAANGR